MNVTMWRFSLHPTSLHVKKNCVIAIENIEKELEERLDELREQDKLLEAQRLEQRTRYDLEMMREMGFCSGIENYSRHLTLETSGINTLYTA